MGLLSRLSIAALLWCTPLSADVISGKAAFRDLGYALDGYDNRLTKTGKTEDSEHFELNLSSMSRVRISFEFSAYAELFDDSDDSITTQDGVKVFFLMGVGQAFCAQKNGKQYAECLVLTQGFFDLLFDEDAELSMFPYIHFESDGTDLSDLINVATSLRRASE